MEKSVKCNQFKFSGHAIKRIFERKVKREWVITVIKSGEVIEEYPDDKPFPSYLLFKFIDGQPLHVVAAVDSKSNTCYVVTVYIPDIKIWQFDFKTRRKK